MASPETAVAWMMHDSIIRCKDASNPFAEFKRVWYRAARYLLHKAESMTTLELLEQHGIDGHGWSLTDLGMYALDDKTMLCVIFRLMRKPHEVNAQPTVIDGDDTYRGGTALMEAVQREDVKAVEYILSIEHLQVNQCRTRAHDDGPVRRGLNALHLAILVNRVDILSMLLQHPDIDVNHAATWHGQQDASDTPLLTAVRTLNMEAFRVLMKHPNIDVNIQAITDGNSAFMLLMAKTASAGAGPGDLFVNADLFEMCEELFPKTDMRLTNFAGESVMALACKSRLATQYVEPITKVLSLFDGVEGPAIFENRPQ